MALSSGSASVSTRAGSLHSTMMRRVEPGRRSSSNGGRCSGRVSLTAFGTYLRFRDRDVLGINTDEIYDERVDVFRGGGRIARHVGMARPES